ncbi:autoinducer binding domain-containing protein [Mesorhizobium sp. M0408]|uniref:autoinducer binding domain-containing protein n=1 Tax=Mesorhizobium sp. M0408 TaxID=2956942 RepID=UPI00333807B1
MIGANEPARYLDEHVDSLVDALELVQESVAIRQALQQFAKTTGFDRFAYGQIQGTDTRIFSNYPEEWLQRYLCRGLLGDRRSPTQNGRYDRSCGREPT